MAGENKKKTAEKWSFADYTFTITGLIVGVFLVGPELLEALFDITLWGGSLSKIDLDIVDSMQTGGIRSVYQFRALSPMLFLIALTVTFAKDTIDAYQTGGYKDKLFNHTFETLLEDTIYVGVMTAMVYSSVFLNAMYISWLASPITWILFIFLVPLLRSKERIENITFPWLMLFILIGGAFFEMLIGGWFFFPLSWLIICVLKLKDAIVDENKSIDRLFNVSYYSLSVILMGLGVTINFWFASWSAFPLSFLICWLVSKTRKYK